MRKSTNSHIVTAPLYTHAPQPLAPPRCLHKSMGPSAMSFVCALVDQGHSCISAVGAAKSAPLWVRTEWWQWRPPPGRRAGRCFTNSGSEERPARKVLSTTDGVGSRA